MEEKVNIDSKVFSGLMWTFGERIFAQGISFIVSIVLARLLLPEEYGIVTIILVFINIANVFVSNGFGEALIQKNDSDDTDFSTIFYCSLTMSIIIYCILWVYAPTVANLYNNQKLIWILRILSLKLPIAGINTIQHAYVSKHMLFKKFFFSTLGGTVLSGIIGIVMAYSGFGVWALIAQYLINSTIDTLVLFFTVPWRPKFLFSIYSAKKLIGYGWKITASSLINSIYSQLRSLIIGKMYSPSDLAYYNKGDSFPNLIITNIDTSIGRVIFPAMVVSNTNHDRMKAISRRAMKTTSYVIFPIIIGLISVGQPLIELLLTEKWNPCIQYLQISCFFWIWQPIQTTNWQIMKAVGRSDLCFKLEVIKKIIGVFLILISIQYGVIAIAASNAVFGFISMVINMLPNKKLIGYSIVDQILDLIPSFILSIIMGGIVYLMSYLTLPTLLLLICQIIVGIVFYIGVSIILQLDSYVYINKTVKSILEKIKK